MPDNTSFNKFGRQSLLLCALAFTLFCNSGRAHGNGSGSPAAPEIITAPQSTSVVLGESVTLTVKADGNHPLRYTWRKNGNIIPGARHSKLKLKGACPAMAGEYTVEISNRYGTNISAPVTVSVVAPSLRIYRFHGIKLRLQVQKGIQYTIECNNACSTMGWTTFATIQNKNGTVIISDPSAPTNPMRLFRLRADMSDHDCHRHHHDSDGDDEDDHDDDDDDDDDDRRDHDDD